jgi:hypothetical protein
MTIAGDKIMGCYSYWGMLLEYTNELEGFGLMKGEIASQIFLAKRRLFSYTPETMTAISDDGHKLSQQEKIHAIEQLGIIDPNFRRTAGNYIVNLYACGEVVDDKYFVIQNFSNEQLRAFIFGREDDFFDFARDVTHYNKFYSIYTINFVTKMLSANLDRPIDYSKDVSLRCKAIEYLVDIGSMSQEKAIRELRSLQKRIKNRNSADKMVMEADIASTQIRLGDKVLGLDHLSKAYRQLQTGNYPDSSFRDMALESVMMGVLGLTDRPKE